ncbi:E3 ubiquitin-protein ligase TRIM7-like [Bufo bufo]|uniref:E3 ubiquitin-protein ligase TRIM7-like n=1 Tax=Bufo bufo TaxID=8384 RepID=UPI001ABED87B|nr:E3 ubiquitin-protein ligase TRIM7-like [Bufo bufo]
MASADLRDELNCSICLNVYTDPVTLRCGHNFCWGCIVRVLDSQWGTGAYSCPECRQIFNKRPVLYKNVTLRSIVKHFQPPPGQKGKAEVICTYCLHCPVPAVKSCVLCEASLCGKHLKVHNKSPKHALSEPTTCLENRKCSTHNGILEYYCLKDEMCICVYCQVDGDHNGHQVQSLNEASEEKKENLTKVLETLTSKKKEAETKIQNLQERLKKEKAKAAKMKGNVNTLLTDLRKQMEDVERRVLSEISGQEKQVSVFILDQIQQLEIKKNHLSNNMGEIEELCKMTDPITVLQDPKCQNNWGQEDDEDLCDQKVEDTSGLDEDLIKKSIHQQVSNVTSHVNPWLFLLDPVDLSLDVNMAANNLCTSENLKTASLTYEDEEVPDCPERFPENEVLSTLSFSSGQHYWEVDTSDLGTWIFGVSYPRENGVYGASWTFQRNSNQCLAVHESNVVYFSCNSCCRKFGVYLAYEAGQLSIYQLGVPVRHLHTFTATFTKPLYAFFWSDSTDAVALEK